MHPNLWRQSTLTTKQGLFGVVRGIYIYQAHSFDISNITFVDGNTGIIVIDSLVSTEVTAATLDWYRSHQDIDSPVVAVICTYSQVDHFGSVLMLGLGLTTQADADPAMARHATYMYSTRFASGLSQAKWAAGSARPRPPVRSLSSFR
ncbi:hypothetical protein [Mycobacterium lepromatosis]|uniref:hypothetical protein n=1 Tax=Mycobacterium lepromatosis TaxID=480418 RepID=UPI003D092B1A